ncbi:hypothetical protein ACGF5M_03430 [Gemmatimonadota bacterium]
MPFTYQVDPVHLTVFVWLHGRVTGHDVRGYRTALLADPEWKQGYHRLLELSEIAKLEAPTVDVKNVAREGVSLGDQFGDGKVAIVAPTDFVFAIARMFQAFEENPGNVS